MRQVLNGVLSSFKLAQSIFKLRGNACKKQKDKNYTIYCTKINPVNTIYGVLAACFGLQSSQKPLIGQSSIRTDENGSQSHLAVTYRISRVSSRISASQFSSMKAEISSIRLSAMA